MKVVIYANVPKDWQGRIRTPYGIAQFRSYVSRNFITSDQPYTHPSAKAVVGDIIIWAFKEEETWYLLGDCFVCYKSKGEGYWNFWLEGARLYPRSVLLSEVSFAAKTRIALNVGRAINWDQYKELLEKAGTPLVEA
jgi:hypothetical protein